jgi:hypothetical protein
MGLAEAVWRTNAKFGTAIFLTTCSYGFFYTVVNHSSPVDDARAWWTGERPARKYQMRLASAGGSSES